MEKKKLLKLIFIIIVILLVMFAIFVTRKFIIINNIVNKSKEFSDKTNYVAVVQSLQNGTVNILKSYNKDGDYLTLAKTIEKDSIEEKEITIYKKNNEQITIVQRGAEREVSLDKDVFGKVNVANSFSTFDSDLQKLQFAIMSKITTDKYCDTECYLIELGSWKMWVDKQTGLVIREIDGGIVAERFYEFDIVKDEDIVKPDISD